MRTVTAPAQITAATATHRGHVRNVNADAHATTRTGRHTAWSVADGAGDHRAAADVARAAAVYATNHAAQTGDPSGALMFMGGVEAS